MSKKDELRSDEKEAKRLQAEFDEEERLAREKDEANVALTEEWDDMQAKIERLMLIANLVEGSSKREEDELEQEVTKKQNVDDVQETAKVDDDQEATKIKELMKIFPDKEEVAIDAILLATKPPTITAREVTTASIKLLLLEEVTTARGSYYCSKSEVNTASDT
ncbi:hypothetical protein Tco_0508026 [Tanacetum coccineum]